MSNTKTNVSVILFGDPLNDFDFDATSKEDGIWIPIQSVACISWKFDKQCYGGCKAKPRFIVGIELVNGKHISRTIPLDARTPSGEDPVDFTFRTRVKPLIEAFSGPKVFHYPDINK